jgi:hypothetical protein
MHGDPDVFGLQLILLLGHNGGCDGEYTDAQLRRAWEVYRHELMEHSRRPRGRPGLRAWAYWVFDVGLEVEPEWPAGIGLLAERGELAAWERERIAADARQARQRRDAGEMFSQEALDAAEVLGAVAAAGGGSE